MKLLSYVSKRGLRSELGKLAREGYANDKSTVYGKRCVGLYVADGIYDFYLDLECLRSCQIMSCDGDFAQLNLRNYLPLGRVWVCGKSTHYESSEEAATWISEQMVQFLDYQTLTASEFDNVMECAEKNWFHDHLLSFDIPY